jgi:hypothetical protein
MIRQERVQSEQFFANKDQECLRSSLDILQERGWAIHMAVSAIQRRKKRLEEPCLGVE